jgi:hypothetical protein
VQAAPEQTRTVGDAFNDMLIVLLDNLAIAIPMLIVGGLVPWALAWMKKRKAKIVDLVESEAVLAEMQHGEGAGPDKHAQVSDRVHREFTITQRGLDAVIRGPGVEAADAYRASLPVGEPN